MWYVVSRMSYHRYVYGLRLVILSPVLEFPRLANLFGSAHQKNSAVSARARGFTRAQRLTQEVNMVRTAGDFSESDK